MISGGPFLSWPLCFTADELKMLDIDLILWEWDMREFRFAWCWCVLRNAAFNARNLSRREDNPPHCIYDKNHRQLHPSCTHSYHLSHGFSATHVGTRSHVRGQEEIHIITIYAMALHSYHVCYRFDFHMIGFDIRVSGGFESLTDLSVELRARIHLSCISWLAMLRALGLCKRVCGSQPLLLPLHET